MLPKNELEEFEKYAASQSEILMPYKLADRIIAMVVEKGGNSRNDVMTMLVEYVALAIKMKDEGGNELKQGLEKIKNKK